MIHLPGAHSPQQCDVELCHPGRSKITTPAMDSRWSLLLHGVNADEGHKYQQVFLKEEGIGIILGEIPMNC